MSNTDCKNHEVQQPLVEEIIDLNDTCIVVDAKKWNGNICDCFNNIYPSMICSFITTNIYLSLMYKEITKNKNAFFYSLLTYSFLNVSGILIYSYSNTFGKILVMSSSVYTICMAYFVRNKTRITHNIPGSNEEDLALSIFCTPCSIAQSARTLYDYDKICDSL